MMKGRFRFSAQYTALSTRFLLMLTAGLAIMLQSADARVTRVMPDDTRNEWIQELDGVLNYEDPELQASFPYVINPFFFEQPLLLKLNMPGGVKDIDLLTSIGELLKDEVSGAFVRGSRRYLLMKSGNLVKETDALTRQIPDFGNMEATATVVEILRDGFILHLNEETYTVDLSGND